MDGIWRRIFGYRRKPEPRPEPSGGERPANRRGPVEIGPEFVRGILSTREDEVDCDRCFELLDRFVELELEAGNAAEALPLVRDHLDRCPDCREEYETLLAALQWRAGE